VRVFEIRALRRIFGLEKVEGMGGWRKLHNEELRNLYSSPVRMIKSQRMSLARACNTNGGRVTCRLLVGKSEGKRH
jgi:hypothetical protein